MGIVELQEVGGGGQNRFPKNLIFERFATNLLIISEGVLRWPKRMCPFDFSFLHTICLHFHIAFIINSTILCIYARKYEYVLLYSTFKEPYKMNLL